MSDSPHFPPFSIDTVPTNFLCKQDKIEISIGAWEIDLAQDIEAAILLQNLGASPPIYRNGKRLRLRDGFDETNGWIFNRINLSDMPDREWRAPDTPPKVQGKLKVRTDPLEIWVEGEKNRTVPSPLFGGYCRWQLEFVGGRKPYRLLCLLDLSINPTRYFVHQADDREDDLRMQRRTYWDKVKPPHGEYSWNDADNWIPRAGRLLRFLKNWPAHVKRYLLGIERAFESELERVAPGAWQRPIKRYNIKKVETYAEFWSDNPLAVVDGLRTSLSSFASNATTSQYNNIKSGIDQKMPILRAQLARGEHLKIYSKTNRRVRMEVTHNFNTKDRFQFPRRRHSKESSAHRFESVDEVITFIARLENKSIEVFTEFFAHTKKQNSGKGFRTPPYQALLHVHYCLPDDYDTATTLVAMLVHHRRIVVPTNATQDFRDGVQSLLKNGIIEKGRGKTIYTSRSPYRDAFAMLADFGHLAV